MVGALIIGIKGDTEVEDPLSGNYRLCIDQKIGNCKI